MPKSEIDLFINNYQERQCEYVAAYLLVKRVALVEMRDVPGYDIAGVVDVPPHLVELRWAIWRKHGR